MVRQEEICGEKFLFSSDALHNGQYFTMRTIEEYTLNWRDTCELYLL